jgi:hypothetical protein
MREILGKAAGAIGRRRLLARASAITFGVLAGVAVGRAPIAMADACTGGPDCGECACRGSSCSRCVATGVSCNAYQGCGNTTCWSTDHGRCCDCRCGYGGYWWYCYCYG